MRRDLPMALAIITGTVLSACGGAAQPSPGDLAPASPTERASVSPSASPSPSPTQEPRATPSATQPPIGFPTRGFPPDTFVVARVDGLRIRSAPGLSGTELGTLASGYESLVVDGPQDRGGLEWYLITGLGLPPASGCITGPDRVNPFTCPAWWGWAARAAGDGTQWLEPTQPTCADPGGPLDDFAYQQRYRYIPCYGNRSLRLHGFLQVYDGIPPGDDRCAAAPSEIHWLGCAGQFQLASSPDVVGMVLAVPPDGFLTDLGETIVEGHFDDPAAAQCNFGEIPERSVLDCRSTFVVTSQTAVSP